jgi:zinc protease
VRARIAPPVDEATAAFAYTAFGPPGTVTSDQREPELGIRQIRFANGVMLNLKRTELDRDRVLVRLNLDGGQMLQTRANPLAVQMFAMVPMGGLGKHDADQLQTILAGRTVSNSLGTSDETFTAGGTTTPADLELQLQLMTAYLTDPGYRPAGEVVYRQAVNNWFAALRATPGSALGADLGGIVSDNDPRFALRPVEEYRELSFAKLRTDIANRLGQGAIELALVGDLDEDQAIALVARTLGTLPQREPAFQPYPEQRSRSFTSARQSRVLRHTGPKDQALLYLTWPTRDGEDPVAVQQLQLLDRVLQITITDTLREELGKAYSPGVSSETSRTWHGWGTLAISASLATGEVDSARAAIRKAITRLRDEPISDDLIQRARAPMLEGLANRLKGNGGWMGYAERAQSKPDRIARFKQAEARLRAVTAADLQALIARYLAVDQALEVLVLPAQAAPE